jgi:hypothetical protein
MLASCSGLSCLPPEKEEPRTTSLGVEVRYPGGVKVVRKSLTNRLPWSGCAECTYLPVPQVPENDVLELLARHSIPASASGEDDRGGQVSGAGDISRNRAVSRGFPTMYCTEWVHKCIHSWLLREDQGDTMRQLLRDYLCVASPHGFHTDQWPQFPWIIIAALIVQLGVTFQGLLRLGWCFDN